MQISISITLDGMLTFVNPCTPTPGGVDPSTSSALPYADWDRSLQIALLLPCSARLDAIESIRAVGDADNAVYTPPTQAAEHVGCRRHSKFRNRQFQTIAIDGDLLTAVRHGRHGELKVRV
jgi:hypothetical protein